MVLAVAVALVAAVALVRAVLRGRVAEAARHPAELWAALGAEPDGRATLVTFTSSLCLECAAQERVLAEVAAERRLVVDAGRQPQVARAFGVVTTPSTAVLGARGELIAVNHGLADAARLRGQLTGARRASA